MGWYPVGWEEKLKLVRSSCRKIEIEINLGHRIFILLNEAENFVFSMTSAARTLEKLSVANLFLKQICMHLAESICASGWGGLACRLSHHLFSMHKLHLLPASCDKQNTMKVLVCVSALLVVIFIYFHARACLCILMKYGITYLDAIV